MLAFETQRTGQANSAVLGSLVALVLLLGCASGPPPTPTARGEAALAEGDWQKAKGHFGEALKLNEQNGAAWHGLARAQLAGRKAESALKSLASLRGVDPERFRGVAQPDYLDTLEAVTRSRLARNESKGALAAVRALASQAPHRRGLRVLVGRTAHAEADRLRLRGDPAGAYALYAEACRAAPDRLEAWVAAVEILLEQRDSERAMKMLSAARERHPTAGVIRTLTLQVLQLR